MVLNQNWLTCYNCFCYAMLPVTTRTIAVISYDAWIKCLFKLQMMKQIFKKKPAKLMKIAYIKSILKVLSSTAT